MYICHELVATRMSNKFYWTIHICKIHTDTSDKKSAKYYVKSRYNVFNQHIKNPLQITVYDYHFTPSSVLLCRRRGTKFIIFVFSWRLIVFIWITCFLSGPLRKLICKYVAWHDEGNIIVESLRLAMILSKDGFCTCNHLANDLCHSFLTAWLETIVTRSFHLDS